MVAPTFILTRTFAISALIVGALPIAYSAPVPTEAAVASSSLDRRFCRMMGCLFAEPEGDANSSNSSAAASVPPSAEASASALQVIDLLISALQSAASTLRQPSTAQAALPAVNAAIPSAVDAAEPVEGDALAAIVATLANAAVPADATSVEDVASPALPADAQEDASEPAVEVVGFSTVASTDVVASAST